MSEQQKEFFADLSIWSSPNQYVFGRIRNQNILMVIYMAFFSIIIAALILITSFMGIGNYHTIRTGSSLYFEQLFCIAYIIALVLIQIYLRSARKNYDAHSFGAVAGIVIFCAITILFGVVMASSKRILGDSILIFVVSVIMIFTVILMPPYLQIAGTCISFSAFYAALSSNADSVLSDIISAGILLFVINLIGFINYSAAKHRYELEESLLEANNMLKDMSLYDNLTGLKNRNAWRQDFNNLIGESRCLMICDIDDFKGFNDTFGHATGDRVLKAIADMLADTYGRDKCYRFGGDEFVIVSEMSVPEFKEIYSILRERNDNIKIEGIQLKPTLSAGAVNGKCQSADDLRRMLKMADKALYEVKTTGKNNLIVKELNSSNFRIK